MKHLFRSKDGEELTLIWPYDTIIVNGKTFRMVKSYDSNPSSYY